MSTRPAEYWSTSAASIELVLPSQLTSPLAGPLLGGDVGVGAAVLSGSGVFVGVAVSSGGWVFGGVGVEVAAGGEVLVGGGVLVGTGVFVGAGGGGGAEPPLVNVAFTDWLPFIVTNVDLVELSSVPVHDSHV